jgi:hypothetical protein
MFAISFLIIPVPFLLPVQPNLGNAKKMHEITYLSAPIHNKMWDSIKKMPLLNSKWI